MTRLRFALLFTIGLGVTTGVLFADNLRNLRALLSGYQEVPTLSTKGHASFEARISNDESQVDWQLSYADTESAVQQAHIHFSAPAMNGPIVVFLCTNLGNGPAGTQLCTAAPATISGTFTSGDVLGNAAAMGLAAGELDELIAAIRAGATYANVHTTLRPGGEVRGQISAHDARQGH
jgi:CHRD domain